MASLERLAATGMFHDYQQREEISSFPRGRVLVHRTVQNLLTKNVRHAAHVTWSARSTDNACNRCLKYALWSIAQFYISHPLADKKLRGRINALYPAFDGVELDANRRFLSDPTVRGTQPLPFLWSYYRDALNIALAVIEKRGILIDSMEGDLRLASLILDMSSIFERYIRTVLTRHAIDNKWALQVLDGNEPPGRKPLYNGTTWPHATPDIIVRQSDGHTSLVCEVKNIPVQAEFSDRDAINQALTYAVRYSAKQALLIHPCASASQEPGMYKLGDIGDIAIHRYRFNLGAEDLIAENSRFGHAVGSILA